MVHGNIAEQIILNHFGHAQFETETVKVFVVNDYGEAKKLFTDLQDNKVEIGIDLSYGACDGKVRFAFKDPEILIFQSAVLFDCITFKGMVAVIDKQGLIAPEFFIESGNGIDIFNGDYTQGYRYDEEEKKRYKIITTKQMDNWISSPERIEMEENKSASQYCEVIVNTRREIIAYLNVHYDKEGENILLHNQNKGLLYYFNENSMNSMDVAKYLTRVAAKEMTEKGHPNS